MTRSWSDKLREARPHQVKPAPIDIAGMKAGQMMLVPSPQIVDAFIRGIPEGRGMDLRELRIRLAKRYRAEVTCPITMDFQLRIVAEAAWEAHRVGAKLANLTPVWRVMDDTSPTFGKLSVPAQAFLRKQREMEARKIPA